MKPVDVSIIIPNLNMGQFLERSIKSVLNQSSHQNFEIIVVDGGSTDNSLQIIKNFNDSRINFITYPSLVSDARNLGVACSNSENICFLDADDEWLPNFLEIIFNLKERFPYAGLFATGYIKFEANNVVIYPKYAAMPEPPWEGIIPNYIRTTTLSFPPVWTSALMIRKKVFQDIGCFKIKENIGEDLDLWFRIALKHSIAFSSERCAIYHHENAKNSKMYLNRKPIAEPVLVTAEECLNDSSIPQELRDDILEFIAKQKIGFALNNLSYGFNKESRKILLSTKTKIFYKEKLGLFILSLMPRVLSQKIAIKLFY